MQSFEILLYAAPEGKTHIEVFFEEESFWLSQKKMAELFGVDVRTVNEHLQNIFITTELEKEPTIRKFRIVQQEGTRSVSREVDFYNLDAIIAVGYRVNSHETTRFRIWATKTLREFIIKGFVLDDERLKQGKKFGKDYFDELLERIRDKRRRRRLGRRPIIRCLPEKTTFRERLFRHILGQRTQILSKNHRHLRPMQPGL